MDIKKAKGNVSELKLLLHTRPGGKADPTAHNHLAKLCEEIRTWIPDGQCELLCASIEESGKHLFSMRGHERYARGMFNGSDILRNRISDALTALDGRIINVEAITRTKKRNTLPTGK